MRKIVLAVAVLGCSSAAEKRAPRPGNELAAALGSYDVNLSETTASGISSGACAPLARPANVSTQTNLIQTSAGFFRAATCP